MVPSSAERARFARIAGHTQTISDFKSGIRLSDGEADLSQPCADTRGNCDPARRYFSSTDRDCVMDFQTVRSCRIQFGYRLSEEQW